MKQSEAGFRWRALAMCAAAVAAFVPAAPSAMADLELVAVPPQGETVFEPKAQEVLSAAMEHAAALRTLTFDLTLSTALRDEDDSVSRTLHGEIRLGPEDQLYLSSRNELNETRLISDGKDLTIFDVTENAYFQQPVMGARDLMVSAMGDDLSRVATMFIGAYLHNDPEVFEGASSIRYGGVEEKDGASCHRIDATFPDFNVQSWITEGGAPALHRLRIDLTEAMRDALERENVSAVVTASLDQWSENPDLDMAMFAFVPPEGARREEPHGPGGGGEGGGGVFALLGKEAPALELDLLDGGKMSLAEHRDKEVVVLDFWATWCGPCRVGLPILAEVSERFAEQGVVFYAVNLQEEPERIREFLKSHELDIAVPLDKGSAADNFSVVSIPTTVIVGKNGLVEAIHVGVAPNLESRLTEELTTLSAGGTLL